VERKPGALSDARMMLEKTASPLPSGLAQKKSRVPENETLGETTKNDRF